MPCVPVRTPFTLRFPASIQIMFSPRFWICSPIWADAPWPTATLQIKAPTPMLMPSIVKALRSVFRVSSLERDPNQLD